MPIDEPDRDTVDLVVGVAASLRLARGVRAGIEVLAEDLEGLWEPDEAEGGARLLAAPTVWLGLGAGWDLRVSTGIHAGSGGAGFLGRATVGFAFQ